MICWITLDYVDGSKSKAVKTDLAGLSLSSMVFKMMEQDVVGFTVTKAMPVTKLADLHRKAADRE